MQPLFYFSRASTGLAPAPKTLARAAFLLAQITAAAPPQAHRKLPAHPLRDYPPRGRRGEPTAPPAQQNPPLERVQFEFILKTGIFSPRAEPCGFHGRHVPDFQPAPSPLKLAKLSRQPVALGQQVRQSVRAPRRRMRVVPLNLGFYPGQCGPQSVDSSLLSASAGCAAVTPLAPLARLFQRLAAGTAGVRQHGEKTPAIRSKKTTFMKTA